MLLPLGVRTLDKVVRVIDEELQAIGKSLTILFTTRLSMHSVPHFMELI